MQNGKLIKKLAILSLLLMIFGFLVVSEQTSANALGCCRDCIQEDEDCSLDCLNYYSQLPQDEDTLAAMEACYTRCAQMRNYCSQHQQNCNPGCSGCTSSSECGVTGCVCNSQHRCVCL